MEVFLGTICAFATDHPPRDWAGCEGQILKISQFGPLFSLLSNKFGGDGQSTFALPDLRATVAPGSGQGPGLSNYPIGYRAGKQFITLDQSNVPSHTHTVSVSIKCSSERPTSNSPVGAYPCNNDSSNIYGERPDADKYLGGNGLNITLGNSSAPETVDIMKPYVAICYCIAMLGEFPPRD